MKDYKFINRAKTLNPLFVILYAVLCHFIIELAWYGGIRRRLPMIILLFSILFFWLIYRFRRPFSGVIYPDDTEINRKINWSKIWFYIAVLALISQTGFAGYRIYQSAIPYNGRLSWYVADYFTKKEVPFEHNNIHTHGLNGLLTDIETEVELPDELFLSGSFTVTYELGGEMTELNGFLYGENEEQEIKSFLISYDLNQSNNIQIRLDGYVDATFADEKKFRPFLDGLDVVDLETYDSILQDDEIELYYEGFREIPSYSAPAYYYDAVDLVSYGAYDGLDYAGFSFTLQTPSLVTHYIQYDEAVIENQIAEREEKAAQDADSNYFSEDEIAAEYFLNDSVGYQLVVLDAALGSRFYGLRKTTDGGENWILHSDDPFLGSTGVATDLTFIDENLGFAVLSKSGGIYADLFRSVDGGLTFNRVEIPSVTVEQAGVSYEPFDFPEVPFEEDERLFLYVGQGADSDYAGGIRALYASLDLGETFEFIEMEE